MDCCIAKNACDIYCGFCWQIYSTLSGQNAVFCICSGHAGFSSLTRRLVRKSNPRVGRLFILRFEANDWISTSRPFLKVEMFRLLLLVKGSRPLCLCLSPFLFMSLGPRLNRRTTTTRLQGHCRIKRSPMRLRAMTSKYVTEPLCDFFSCFRG